MIRTPALTTPLRMLTLIVGILVAALSSISVAEPPNFQDDVLPIFREHCLGCHNPDESEAGLDLSTSRSVVAGSSGGSVVKAGLPDSSPLFMTVSHDDEYPAMPPDQPRLPDKQLKTIRDWIAGGLVASAGGKSQLREVKFEVTPGSMKRPEVAAFPKRLAKNKLSETAAAPPIVAMAASPWADLIAVSGHRQVALYGAQTGGQWEQEPAAVFPFPEGDIHDLRFSRGGDVLVVAGGIGARSGRVVLFDVTSGKRIAELGGEYDIILSADISADHRWVAIGTPSKRVKVLSTETGKVVHRIEKHTDWVTVVRFSPDGKTLATADRNGGLHVWDTVSGGIVFTLDEHKMKITALCWRGDGNALASGGEDGKLVLWDMNDGWATRSIIAHKSPLETRYSRRTGVLDVSYATDGRIVSVGRDRMVRLWKVDGTRLQQSRTQQSLPLRTQVLSGQKSVAVGYMDGSIRFLDVPELSNEWNLVDSISPRHEVSVSEK